MKNLIFTVVLTILTLTANAQESKGVTITVTIDNVYNSNGKVIFALHNKETFMRTGGIANTESKIENGKVTVTFSNVAAGEYAIVALHDENENGRMDYEGNGMPKEAYGMSNNVMSFGPPQYEDAKFLVANEDLEMTIRF